MLYVIEFKRNKIQLHSFFVCPYSEVYCLTSVCVVRCVSLERGILYDVCAELN